MYRDKKISVVIPCYNEEVGVALAIDSLPPSIDEVVVVDNNSTDRTAEVATEKGARVVFEKRKGYGAGPIRRSDGGRGGRRRVAATGVDW